MSTGVVGIDSSEDLSVWLRELPPGCRRSAKHLREVLARATSVPKVGVAMANALQRQEELCRRDPLLHWLDVKSDAAARVLQRVQDFADKVCAMTRWSWLTEPGRTRTQLSVSTVLHGFSCFLPVEGFPTSCTVYYCLSGVRGRVPGAGALL